VRNRAWLRRGCDQANGGGHRVAGYSQCDVPGSRSGVSIISRDAAVLDRGRDRRGVHHSRNALRVLHPHNHVTFDDACCRRRIVSTLPSAGVGALLMLILFHYDLSVIALIGIILLIGIVKKNAIMMIDFALDAERHQGLPPEKAIYQACLLRFRPIMMTTMAALLGGIPLMLSYGTGSELRRPLGYTMVGGLLLSQWLTLYPTAVVYLYLSRLRAVGRRTARSTTAQRIFGIHAPWPVEHPRSSNC